MFLTLVQTFCTLRNVDTFGTDHVPKKIYHTNELFLSFKVVVKKIKEIFYCCDFF